MRIHNRQELKFRRKDLRNFGTSAEASLWLRLKGKQFEGRKFKGNTVLVVCRRLYCPSEKLVVEPDGEGHFTEEGRAFDEERSGVCDRLDVVLKAIKKMFKTTRADFKSNVSAKSGTTPRRHRDERFY